MSHAITLERETRRTPPWGPILLAFGIAGLVFHIAAGIDTTLGSLSYDLIMVAAAAAVTARAIRVPNQRLAWSLIALGMGAWAAGDIYYNEVLLDDPGNVPYPSVSDGLYFVMYAALLSGLGVLRGRARGESLLSSGVIVSILGLATIWSVLVLDEVIGGAEGTTAAVATSVAYPLLDLGLLLSAILAFAARNWRFDRVLGMLVFGFLLVAVADSFYATNVAAGQTWNVFIDALWPAGALAIATSAWLKPSAQPKLTEVSRSVSAFAATAIGIAATVLTIDHFARLETFTIVLAGLTLLVAAGQLLIVNRDRLHARSRASVAEALRSASTEAALDCVITIDAHGIVQDWNRAARRTFGYRRDDAIGAELAELIIPPDQRDRHRKGLARAAAEGGTPLLDRRVEMIAQTARGTKLPVELAISQVQSDPPMYTGFIRDISDRRRRDEENERLATIVRSSEDAILSKDLDGRITAWNHGAERLYGYSAEEAIGRPAASLIVPPDRLGEDAKVTALAAAGEAAALETQRTDRHGNILDISVRMLAMRDAAGNIVGISSTAHDITDRRRREERERLDREGREWRERIECAMAEDRLVFWAQPVVDPLTGTIDHHELLVRMVLDGEVITPNHFLPHAERSGLITEIDRWAVRTGARVARTMPVAINLSAKSIGDPTLLEEIQRAVTSRSHAERITFEITETAAAENISAAHDLVAALTALGCGVALDDFGTGYASFTYLKNLPVTELKIDMEFVRGLTEDTANQRVVRSLIDVANNFGMRTVAEGVEDEQTLGVLRRLGVDLVQGYHLGRPAPLKPEEDPRQSTIPPTLSALSSPR